MPETFRVDPEALADAVERMAEFQRYAESMLAEIDSQVANLHATWSGKLRRLMLKRIGIGLAARR
jgi:uncharacterized protein YukE